MYKNEFQQLNEPLHAGESLIQHTLQAAERCTARQRHHGWLLVGTVTAALFLMVAVMFSTQPAPKDQVASNGGLPETTETFMPLRSGTAPAAPTATTPVYQTDASKLHDPFVQDLLANNVPELAESFAPVGLRTEHSGISFEVVAACLDNGLPVILTAVNGQEIDAHTSFGIGFPPLLFTEYSMPGGYDEESGTKYILVICKRGQTIRPGDEIDIRLHDLEFNTPYEYTIQHDIDLSQYGWVTATQTVQAAQIMDWPEDIATQGGYHIAAYQKAANVLIPDEPVLTFPCGKAISAIGIVDGKLHVQTCSPAHSGDSFLSLAIMPRSAEEYSIDYIGLLESDIRWSDETGAFSYAEYIFRIESWNREDYVLRTEYRAPGKAIDGEWCLTFTMPKP